MNAITGEGQAAPESGRYVYCVVRSDRHREFGEIGIGSSLVYTINDQDLAAVVSDTSPTVHEPTRENVIGHEFVNETVMREFTVIPMAFGTVFRSEQDVSDLLRSTYRTFSDAIDKMEDKVEFGLRVLWDRDRVTAGIECADEGIRHLKAEISRNSDSSTYFARTQLSRAIESATEEAANRYVTEIHESLKEVALASRSNKVIGDRMIANAAFLVDRKEGEAFNVAVSNLLERYGDVLTFKRTGPWPPYNFVNIKLKLDKAL